MERSSPNTQYRENGISLRTRIAASGTSGGVSEEEDVRARLALWEEAETTLFRALERNRDLIHHLRDYGVYR